MNILFEHKGILPVKHYGGTERQIYWIIKRLRQLGHQVWLIGHPLSNVKNLGVNLIERPSTNWSKVIPNNIDIIHIFSKTEEDLNEYPHLITIGGNGQLGEIFPLNTVFVSKQHAINHNSTSFVNNGIDFDEYPLLNTTKVRKSWEKILFMAKASWKVKNLKSCVYACRKNRKKLHIVGGRSFFSYFSPYIYSHNQVSQKRKLEILATSDLYLFPVRWHEPFGITILEAYSQGLAVIGSPYGSLPYLIDKETGIICNNEQELIDVLANDSDLATKFDPEKIREKATTYFTLERMVDDYIDLYKKVMRGEKLNETYPSWKLSQSPQTLLSF
ncbi:MAG: glycosyltransferase [Oligoflexia bacterium]|nr:glycosyltransferase [Oligoflexia bacterium]